MNKITSIKFQGKWYPVLAFAVLDEDDTEGNTGYWLIPKQWASGQPLSWVQYMDIEDWAADGLRSADYLEYEQVPA